MKIDRNFRAMMPAVSPVKFLLSVALLPTMAFAAMPEYEISQTHYNRVAIVDKQILTVRVDENECDVEIDPTSSDVYVLPKTENSFAMYITDEDGNTQLIKFHPKTGDSVNLEIQPARKLMKARNIPWPEPNDGGRQLSREEEGRLILGGDLPEGFMRGQKPSYQFKNRSIALEPIRSLQSTTGSWIVFNAKNRTRNDLKLGDWSFLPSTAKSVITKNSILKKHAKTSVAIYFEGAA